MMIGYPRAHHRLIDSTNRVARDLVAAGAPHGTLVTAGEQSAGRGRSDRAWMAPAGSSVLMSVVLRELGGGGALLPLTASVAVSDVLDEWVGAVSIKWPNDVWIGGRKVAGILVEGRPHEDWVVLGIGLNVLTAAGAFPPELRESATSIAAAGGGTPALEEVLALLLTTLHRRLGQTASAVLAAWRERDALLGSAIAWDGGEGVAAGIDDSGALLVDVAGGRVALDAGEVHLGAML
ncbi:MAG: biotin--[acetyl-CoA-carboxylase] ligase [Thermoleophilaceae bacterium]